MVPVNLNISSEGCGLGRNGNRRSAGGDLLENDSTLHTDVDRGLFDKLPLESASSSVSSLVTLAIAGNRGRFERPLPRPRRSRGELVLGRRPADHRSAEQGLLQSDSARFVQSLEVISGRAAGRIWRQDQRGDRRDHALRPGRDARRTAASRRPTARFGTSNVGIRSRAMAAQKWGNFISVSGLNTGRFLDPPEFAVMHDKGNEENIFDRVDYQTFPGRFDSPEPRLHALLVPDAEFLRRQNRRVVGVVVDNGGLGPNGQPSGPPTSVRRSRRSTSRRRGRG